MCTSGGECVQPTASFSGPEAELPQSTVHRHDGFFVRLTLGPSFGAVGLGTRDEDEDYVDVGFAGGGWNSSLDIGGSNGDNLAIFGRLRHVTLVDANLYLDDDEVRDVDVSLLTQSMIGVGVSYFIMPLNMYLGAAVGMGLLTTSYKRPGRLEVKYDSDVGFALDAEIGKEWWVADDWGVGAAARVSFADIPTGDDEPRDAYFGAIFASLLLSVTYQ
jgi:hypothetical protein